MAPVLITTQPGPWRRRTRTAGRYAAAGALLVLHLAVAVIVLAIRIPYTLITPLAHAAARAELRLSARTGQAPIGQTVGVAIAHAFLTEFAAAHRNATPGGRP